VLLLNPADCDDVEVGRRAEGDVDVDSRRRHDHGGADRVALGLSSVEKIGVV